MSTTRVVLAALVASVHVARVLAWADDWEAGKNCTVKAPLGAGLDDTDQVRTGDCSRSRVARRDGIL